MATDRRGNSGPGFKRGHIDTDRGNFSYADSTEFPETTAGQTPGNYRRPEASDGAP